MYKRQLEQLTEEAWYSPFPQYQTTERPDRAAQELLNGKVVVICDNTPYALILPSSFNGFMESSEDWYHHFEMASFLRILRYLALMTAVLLPGLYLAVIRFHTCLLYTSVKLLQEVYYGSTPQKQIEAKVLRRALRKELSEFKEYVREYQEEEDEQEKGDLRCLLRKELRDSSSFAAFKRWLIRDNKNIFPELYEDITALHKN